MKKLTTIVLGAALLLGSTAYAAEKGNYDHLVPKYNSKRNVIIHEGEEYTYKGKRTLDKNEDGIKDVIMKVFKSGSKYVTQYSKNGKIKVYGIIPNKKNKQDPKNYMIADFDGKKGFETKLRGNESFDL